MFTVASDELPMQPEMFATIGEIVVHWSRVENALDDEITAMRRYPIVNRLADAPPHTFGKKLELWRRSVRTLYPKITEYQSYADGFNEAVKKVVKVRNHIIHGQWSLSENDDGEFLVMNYRTVKGIERTDTLWVGQKVLNDLLSDVEMLAGSIMGFTITKMVHAHEGLLQADPQPSSDHPAHPTPASPDTQQEPPLSSPE